MHDETEDLSKTLAWTIGMITQSNHEARQRIASAYQEAQHTVASISTDNGSARPRILVCFERSDAYRAVEDIACVGWTLTAIEERVNEQELKEWQKLRHVIDKTLGLLPITSAIH